jgi:taurine--2-oxoglutarate transaminase
MDSGIGNGTDRGDDGEDGDGAADGGAGDGRTETERLDRAHVFGTWSRQRDYAPREVVGAEGARFRTADGAEYLDFSSQLVCTNLGYSADRVADRMAEQARTAPYFRSGYATEPRAKLAAKLAEKAPGELTKTFFSTGGALAVEAAVKIARWYTGNRKILTRYRSYHGGTLGTMPLSGDPRRHYSPGSDGVVRAPEPSEYARENDPMETLGAIEETLRREHGTVAAVLVEPVGGSSSGVLVPPEEYLPRLAEIAHDHGALLICDEVMTGFGRTGAWFASERFGVEPDIVTMAKGLTGSYAPLGATTVTREIADFFEDRPFAHGHTFSGHPVACAAGLGAVETYEEEGLIDRSRELEGYLRSALDDLAEDHPSVGAVRGMGLFFGVELSRRTDRREPFVDRSTELDSESTVLDHVAAAAADRGLYLFTRFNSVMVSPPLTVTREEIDEGIAILDEALAVADREVVE